jgi:hypothetical protein
MLVKKLSMSCMDWLTIKVIFFFTMLLMHLGAELSFRYTCELYVWPSLQLHNSTTPVGAMNWGPDHWSNCAKQASIDYEVRARSLWTAGNSQTENSVSYQLRAYPATSPKQSISSHSAGSSVWGRVFFVSRLGKSLPNCVPQTYFNIKILFFAFSFQFNREEKHFAN